MAKFSVIYDACVLYPAPLRDLLMQLALTDLFKARWTDKIHEEWIEALLRRGKYDRKVLERTRELMDAGVRDAKVSAYEDLIEALALPDPNDRHVLAAAIKAGANTIVTFNLKDFPSDVLSKYSIEAIHPDEFVYCQIDLAPAIACGAIKRQRESLKNPSKEKDDFSGVSNEQAETKDSVGIFKEEILKPCTARAREQKPSYRISDGTDNTTNAGWRNTVLRKPKIIRDKTGRIKIEITQVNSPEDAQHVVAPFRKNAQV